MTNGTTVEHLVLASAIIVSACGRHTSNENIEGMKSDLRNLAAIQEAYHAENGTYTSDPQAYASSLSAFRRELTIRLHPSYEYREVRLDVPEAYEDGWRGVARFYGKETVCEIYEGDVVGASIATDEGRPMCND